MKRTHVQISFFCATAFLVISCVAEPGPLPKSVPTSVKNPIRSHEEFAKAIDVSDLTFEMAESSYKLTPSAKTLSDLISSLENFLVNRCVSKEAYRELKYAGQPTDPICFARMKRLLDLHSDNPIGTCIRDGIDAASCRDAFGRQIVSVYDESQDTQADLIDPVLKAGYPAKIREKLEGQKAKIDELDKQYQAAQTPEQKEEIKKLSFPLYDEMLATACSIVSTRFIPKVAATPVPLHPRVQEIKDKLSKIPPAMLPDYQKQMSAKLEEQLANVQNDDAEKKLLVQMIQMIQSPEEVRKLSVESLQRTRLILPYCNIIAGKISSIESSLPQPVCHRMGWFSPDCFDAIKAYKRKIATAKQQKEASEKGNTSSVISSF